MFSANQNIPHITVQELQARLQDASAPLLLDVREADELEICVLPGHYHIPLGQIPQRYAELPTDRPIVVYCHHGGRSAKATYWLHGHGYTQSVNLAGGIEAWATHIAPEMQRY